MGTQPNTDASKKPSPLPRIGKRWRRTFFAILNLGAVILLIHLYFIYALRHRQNPVYSQVVGTPVETYLNHFFFFLRKQQITLHQQAGETPLLADEKKAANTIIAQMQNILPTHAILLNSGKKVFGRLIHKFPDRLVLDVFDGREHHQQEIFTRDIKLNKRILIPPVELSSRDIRFLISFGNYNAYCLPPYLIVGYCGFQEIQELQFTLTLLQDEFTKEFAPLLQRDHLSPTSFYHICFFRNEQTFLNELAQRNLMSMVNSQGFFRETDRTLFLYNQGPESTPFFVHHYYHYNRKKGKTSHPLPAVHQSPESGNLAPGEIRIIRHEGTHLLAAELGVLMPNKKVPLWIAEGMAQYCESRPFGKNSPIRYAVLKQAAEHGNLLPLSQLIPLRASTGIDGPEDLDIVYAQSWQLFRFLMKAPKYRAKFMRYLAEFGSNAPKTEISDPLLELMNNIGLTSSKLTQKLSVDLADNTRKPRDIFPKK